jgi:hypothetical protein
MLPRWSNKGETFTNDAGERVDGPDGRAVHTDACAGWNGNTIEGWKGGHRWYRREPSSQGTS